MAWYRTGTVDVTNGSATIVGTGTNWVDTIQAGWGFVGPDGRTYEVLDIVNDTEVTLAEIYAGGTLTGQSYKAFPTMSLTADLAAQFQAIGADFQAMIDGPGAGKFADGTEALPSIAFTSDPDTGLQRTAANRLGFSVGGDEVCRMVVGSLRFGDALSAFPGSVGNPETGIGMTPSGRVSLSAEDIQPLSLNRSGLTDGFVARFGREAVTVGSISVDATSTSFNTTSDQRLKQNVAAATGSGPVIDAIQVRSYDWLATGGSVPFGLIAQELEPVFPCAVTRGDVPEEMWSVDYSKLVPLLIAEIQELRTRVDALEAV